MKSGGRPKNSADEGDYYGSGPIAKNQRDPKGYGSGGRTGYPLDAGAVTGEGRLEKADSQASREGHKPGYKKTGV